MGSYCFASPKGEYPPHTLKMDSRLKMSGMTKKKDPDHTDPFKYRFQAHTDESYPGQLVMNEI